MGFDFIDRTSNEILWRSNYWHWRAIVEVIRSLGVLPNGEVDGLHEQYCNTGLSAADAQRVAQAIRERLLPTLSDDEWLYADGTRTREPPQAEFHRGEDWNRNYCTNKAALAAFAAFCEQSNGFYLC